MEPYTGKLFKVLDNRRSFHGGDHLWIPGEWVKVKGDLVPCQRGIHLCREQDLTEWLGPEIWVAEYRGDEFIIAENKVVVREAMITTKYENWNESTARLLACDFAEKVVHLCDDPRPKDAIRVARLFASGQATKEELAAAWDAAWDAARAAAGDAAAARAAARDAAWAAARAAAWDAAWAAAAAGDAARDAAADAAWAAAWAVARDAAWDAAGDAAWDAAGDAAWDEMRQWQKEQLMNLLFK